MKGQPVTVASVRKGSQPGRTKEAKGPALRVMRTRRNGMRGARAGGERPSEYVCIWEKRKTRGLGRERVGETVKEREREIERREREGERGKRDDGRGGQEEGEGIAEKRQEGGYSRLHPRGSGPSVSPWQPTLKHPPAVALPSRIGESFAFRWQ